MCDTKAPVAPTNGARHRHSGHTYLSIRLRKTGQHGMTAQYSASFSRHARIIDRSSTLPLNGPGTQEGRRSMNLYSLLAMSILLYLYISFLLEAFFQVSLSLSFDWIISNHFFPRCWISLILPCYTSCAISSHPFDQIAWIRAAGIIWKNLRQRGKPFSHLLPWTSFPDKPSSLIGDRRRHVKSSLDVSLLRDN